MTFNRQSFLASALKALETSAKARSVALALAFVSDFDGPSVRYSVPTLQRLTGLSRASVQRALRELEEAGFLAGVASTGRITVARLQAVEACRIVSPAPSLWAAHFRMDSGIWTVSADWVLRCAPSAVVQERERQNRLAGVSGIPISPDLFQGASQGGWGLRQRH